MRRLRLDADLADIPAPLRDELAACLQRWAESGVPYGPGDDLILLVEPGDSVDAVAGYLRGEDDGHGEDFDPPAEWVTDRGVCFEMFICWSDDGNGISVMVPKADGVDPLLLELCAAYVDQQAHLA